MNVLSHASRRLQGRNHDHRGGRLKPLPVNGPFDSAALNGVLHCLPGPFPSKAAAVANVAAVLARRRRVRILDPRGFRATHLVGAEILEANNRRGTFDNLGDTEEGLGEILRVWFERVESRLSARWPSSSRRTLARSRADLPRAGGGVGLWCRGSKPASPCWSGRARRENRIKRPSIAARATGRLAPGYRLSLDRARLSPSMR